MGAAGNGHAAALEDPRDVAGDAFDVLGVEVRPMNDDHFLCSSRDEHVAIQPEAEVSGAQPTVRGEGVVVGPLRQQIAGRHRIPANLDLADLLVVDGQPAGIGAGEPQVDSAYRLAHSDDGPRVWMPGGHLPDAPGVGQQVPVDPDRHRRPAQRRKGDRQRRLGHPVHREHRLRGETGRREVFQEPFDRRQGDGLGTVEGDPPVPHVQPRHLQRGHGRDQLVVAEVGSGGDRRPGRQELAQPSRRVLDEGRG